MISALVIRVIALIFFQDSPLYEPLEGSRHDRATYMAAATAAAGGNFFPEGAFAYMPLYPRPSFGPGQRFINKGGYVLRVVDGHVDTTDARWIIP